MTVLQRYVVDQATATRMFPTVWKGAAELSPPPVVTWLAGPIKCEYCDGSGMVTLPHLSYSKYDPPKKTCPACGGLGYPPRLEIVSREFIDEDLYETPRGVVLPGKPVPVTAHLTKMNGFSISNTNQGVILMEDRSGYRQLTNITAALSGPVDLGDVAYPLTVETCEGSGFPVHDNGMCPMCGRYLDIVYGDAAEHDRPDILAMIDRGDYD